MSMKEIKFRAWDKNHPNGPMMHNWGYLKTWSFKDIEKSEVLLMQYIGFKDKNEIEVYERDIVRAYIMSFTFDGEDNGRVEEFTVGDITGIDRQFNNVQMDTLEVISNTYENKDLLTPNQ